MIACTTGPGFIPSFCGGAGDVTQGLPHAQPCCPSDPHCSPARPFWLNLTVLFALPTGWLGDAGLRFRLLDAVTPAGTEVRGPASVTSLSLRLLLTPSELQGGGPSPGGTREGCRAAPRDRPELGPPDQRAHAPFPLPPAPGRRGPAALVSEVFEQHLGGHILQSLDGFVFALNQEGKFLYISETVSIYLGLSQVELTGSSVFDYIHPGDHSEVLEQLGLRARTPAPPTPPSISSSSSSSSSLADIPEIDASPAEARPSARVQERSFFVRMKSTLTKRGLQVKASGYKVIHVTGRLRARALGLVALGHALPPAPLTELPLHGHMIVFRLSLGLTILACESRVSDHMDLGPSELVGRSCYQFVHGQDATRIRQSHLDLLDKGQVMTGYYRWLQRTGGFVWLQSVATLAGSGKSPGEHHVLWVSHVLSHAEDGQTPLDTFQLPPRAACEGASSSGPEPTERGPPAEGKQAAPPDQEDEPQARGTRIKVEPRAREASGSEHSRGEEAAQQPRARRSQRGHQPGQEGKGTNPWAEDGQDSAKAAGTRSRQGLKALGVGSRAQGPHL
ncbi:neuronal PAS domain-containing protein 1 [Fukomys damarensis]|uniref:neuronal PAS domain-containing protein 1 n=1 Tax=Fukomys damarensis TaxID=885580 RepID=UPI001455CA32|nr:neuronal PAS domain-containing protein 1 [Fukomys damarensis]